MPCGPYTWMVADGLAMGALLAIAARNFAQNRNVFRVIALGAFVVSLLGYFADRVAGHPLFGGAIHITSFNSFYAGMVASILLLGSRFSIRNRLLEFVGRDQLRFVSDSRALLRSLRPLLGSVLAVMASTGRELRANHAAGFWCPWR